MMIYIKTNTTLDDLNIVSYVGCKELNIRNKKIEKLIYKLNKTLFIYEWYIEQSNINKKAAVFNKYWNTLYLKYRELSAIHIKKTNKYLFEYYKSEIMPNSTDREIRTHIIYKSENDVLYAQRYFKIKFAFS